MAELIIIEKAIGHVLLFCLLLLIICQVHALRSPFYATGKFKKTDVNSDQWSAIETKDKVTRIHLRTILFKLTCVQHQVDKL